jgi:membrane protein implicated in regulation of membrane protease activity
MTRPRLQYDDYGWLAVGAVVLAAEIAAPPGRLLTEGACRYKRRRPITWTAVVMTTALHLVGWLPKRVDPIHLFAKACGR